MNIGRKGELKFLVISTDTEVFIFDIEYFGVNAFKMKPRLSLVNDDDETNVYCLLHLLTYGQGHETYYSRLSYLTLVINFRERELCQGGARLQSQQ